MAGTPSRIVLQVFFAIMLAFLLLPLVVTAGAALNDSIFPSVWPWRGFTTRWFIDLANNDRFLVAVRNTVVIALGVVAMAVPIGAAAAIILNNAGGKSRGFLYGIMTAPILTPGAVVGISTLLFWRGADVPPGLLVTTFGQVSIIAAYVMLLVYARLQSFDRAQEEAALDLGANHGQVLWMILFPHLRPALFMGAVISFLQSTESFNVPLFTRGGQETVMIYVASQVRTLLTPMVNALALLILVVTLVCAVLYEIFRRRELRIRMQQEIAAREAEARENAAIAV
ncbi:ABC transporter permease [Corticibacterium sp. UT-5YL-CI-8]|nr:ABC transporter permease [Tianweitania sp. UT-5YL-CI-8]